MARTGSSKQEAPDGDVDDLIARRRWTETEARTVVEAQRHSGLSLRAFARRHRMSAQRLYDWRRRLVMSAAPRFLPVTLKTSTAARPAVGAMTIVVRGGREVRVMPGFDDRMLAQVLRVLEALPC